MRVLRSCAFSFLLATAVAALAQTSGTCAAPIESTLHPGGSLDIESRSSSLQIAAGDQPEVRVTCVLEDSGAAKDVALALSGTDRDRSLRVRGGPASNVQIRVMVPRHANLKIRMPAGEVRVADVAGDLEIEVHAGEISVSGLDASQYWSARGSVDIGDLNATAFGVQKDGFFRNFEKINNAGHYRLRVHVATGSISLE
jgi:hypothetical protein